jgi:hypothetical protein
MSARTLPRSILAWRPRPMTRALFRTIGLRIAGVITLHSAIETELHDHVLIGLLWAFALLTFFVSAALSYQAVRLERRQLLDSAEAYLNKCDAATAAAD